jgi:hypothetical protein
MIKCDDYSVEDYNKGLVTVSLVADTQSEVSAMGSTSSGVVGLKDGYNLALGSTALTADGGFGILDSAGVWNF